MTGGNADDSFLCAAHPFVNLNIFTKYLNYHLGHNLCSFTIISYSKFYIIFRIIARLIHTLFCTA